MKRIFDIISSLFGLILFLPVFIVCAIAVRLTSNGPIFYVSDRIGANNNHFDMIKFRTMRVNAPQVATHLLKDPKSLLTPVGGFLRKTSLDELPQLINVIKGDMSIVGPRPALFNQDDQIELRTKVGCHVLTPGITGWAQINGRDEIPITKKVEFDAWYFQNQSFLLDLKIIWLTIYSVIFGKNVSH
ncbi:sugar transferase [Lentisphaera araneosa HTCC2155]|uniref:Sugar transferase n=1 Tax=Lentisphaera araneosa HTCC2155 TaxID=313628 RepID=A6DHE9_9BACT|nr:sugar transferase [Lentisphaera araneosa]EDM29032.1 sugar transferase [Lentisphaera araneosa HTCC2155]